MGGWGVGGRGRVGGGGQGGCERRIEVFGKIQKKIGGGGGRGSGVGSGDRVGAVRVDVNEELKFLGKFKNKYFLGGSGGGGGVGLGGGGVGQDGCERRIEIFVKIQKKNWGGGGPGGRVGGWSGWM